ncbi:hypothetical protein B0T18DRAFT_423667 [Schizothecium vesticola]|uniref:Uncharacterized protein n=1 Tax=Schizothecium vesticola TaxID=314040 RepID=A0AA40KBP4_9PEZI|nr:hypothetical protein B0T18DRAFT_423667 [Schizothecium vesticola]
MKNLILALIVATALPALAMPAVFRPGVYLSTMPWSNGESVFYDFAVVDPEACHDLDEPLLRRVETFWLIGGDHDCYLFSTACSESCPDDGCTALGPVRHSDEYMFDLSTAG